jgi:hypothetical protein
VGAKLRERRKAAPICACPEFLYAHPDFPGADLVLIARAEATPYS